VFSPQVVLKSIKFRIGALPPESTSTTPLYPTCSRGARLGPKCLQSRISNDHMRHINNSCVCDVPIYIDSTYMIHFLAIESACSSTHLALQNVRSFNSASWPSDSGRIEMGTISSSSQSLEHSLGLFFTSSKGRPAPINLLRLLCSYDTNSAIT